MFHSSTVTSDDTSTFS